MRTITINVTKNDIKKHWNCSCCPIEVAIIRKLKCSPGRVLVGMDSVFIRDIKMDLPQKAAQFSTRQAWRFEHKGEKPFSFKLKVPEMRKGRLR